MSNKSSVSVAGASLCACALALCSFYANAAEPLVTQYIAPVANPTWAAAVTNATYGTGEGFTYYRAYKGVDPRYYNYYITLGGKCYTTWYAWENFGVASSSYPSKLIRSVLSPNAPSKRYLYPAEYTAINQTSSGFEYDWSSSYNATETRQPSVAGNFNLEQEVLYFKLDTTLEPLKGHPPEYVQCVHTDWVYTVTFDVNTDGASGGMENFTFTNSAALPANKFLKTGYSFLAWSTNSLGKGVTISDGGTVADDLSLFATWEANEYTITLDGQSASHEGSTSVKATFDELLSKITPPTRSGYVFGGYFTQKNGNGDKWYDENGNGAQVPWRIDNDVTLYAKWTSNGYVVTFDLNTSDASASATQQSKTVTYGGVYGELPSAGRTGYDFLGWYTSSSEGSQVLATDTVWITQAQTLFAHWTPKTYSVALDFQGGAGGTESVAATYDKPMPTAQKPVRLGYTFGGYWSGKDGEGDMYYSASGGSYRNWNVDSDTTLYAKWTALKCTVTLDRQGGTGGSGAVTATYSQPMPDANMPTRAGYTFLGYYSGEGGGGVQYYTAAGASARDCDFTSATTLYAKWTANPYQVVFDANGGSGEMSPQPFTYGLADSLSPGAFNRTGYTFGGWATSVAGNKAYSDCQVVSNLTSQAGGTVSLYARWTANAYTVRFDANGGVGTMGDESFTYDVSKSLTNNAFSRTGYTFGGWATAPDGDAAYNNREQVKNLSSESGAVLTLYATWQTNEFTVRFNNNAGSTTGSMVDQQFRYDVPQALSANAFERTGYSFAGWATNQAGSAVYGDGQVVSNLTASANAIFNLYTRWTTNDYAITLDMQGGTGGDTSVRVVFGVAMPAVQMPERTGYTFGGYWSEKDGEGVMYYRANGESARTWNVDSDTVLYAKWTAGRYTVTFDRQGGSGGSSTVTATYSQTMPDATMPTRTGYEFMGYYSDMGGGGVQYYTAAGTSAMNCDFTSVKTLYAHWVANAYTVSFVPNKNDVELLQNSKQVTYDSEYGALPQPKLTGYTFTGWYTSASGGDKVESTTMVQTAKNHSLYAQWTANNYPLSLKFNPNITYIHYRPNAATAYSVVSSDSVVDIPYGSLWYAYADAKDGYSPSSTAINPTTGTMGTDGAEFAPVAEAKTYKVTFKPDGGNSTASYAYVVYDSCYGDLPSAERVGYVFLGWFTEDSGGDLVNSETLVSTAGDHNLYAHWAPKTTEITFDKNGGTGGSDSTIGSYHLDLEAIGIPGRRGYEFLGYWYTTENDAKIQFYDANGYGTRYWDVTNDFVELWAKWEPKVYKINFGNTGAIDGLESILLTYDERPANLSKVPSYNKRFSFKGYWTEENGDGEKYWDNMGRWVGGDVWTNIEVNIVYAFAKAVSMTVTFDANGGECDQADKVVEYNSLYGDLPVPTRKKYIFLGWFPAKNGGVEITSDTEVEQTENHTLYAHWLDNTICIRFDANGGKIDGSSVTNIVGFYERGTEYEVLPIPTPAIETLSFAGWWTSTNPVDRVQKLVSDIVDPAVTNLYARWKAAVDPVECSLTFKKMPDGSEFYATNAVAGAEYGKFFPLESPEHDGGYRFLGWYDKDGRRISEYDIIEGDAILTERWTLGDFNDAWGCDNISFTTNGLVESSIDGPVVFGWVIDQETGEAKSGELIKEKYIEQSARLGMQPDVNGVVSFEWKVSSVLQELEFDEYNIFLYFMRKNENSAQYLKHLKGACPPSSFYELTTNIVASATYYWDYQRGIFADFAGLDDCGWVKNLQFVPDSEPSSIDDWTSFTNATPNVSGATWTTGGAKSWATVETNKDIVAVDAVADGRSSWLKLEVPEGKGLLTFKWRVNGEAGYVDTNGVVQACDYLEFSDERGRHRLRVEGVTNDFGEVVWVNNTDSKHTFTWRYVKDGDVAEGDDVAMIKDVVWTPGEVLISAEATGYSGEYDGDGHGISVSASMPASGYDVMYSLYEEGPYFEGCPLLTNACATTIWYVVSAEDFTSFTNSCVVQILQATNEWTTVPAIDGWTEGRTPSAPVGASKFGEVSVSYAAKGGGSFSTEQPAIAGEYVARFTVEETANWSGLEDDVDFTIGPKPLPHVEATGWSVEYDGSGHLATVFSTNENATVLYALSADGPYAAELPLFTNAVNATVWYIVSAAGFATVTNSMTVEVLQATNGWTTAPAIDGWTEGRTPSAPVGASKFGDVSVSYAVKGSVSFSAEQPALAGEYVARFTVDGTDDWTALMSEVDFTIAPKPLPHVEATNLSVAYDGTGHGIGVVSTTEGAAVLYALSVDGPYSAELPLFTNAVDATVWYIVSAEGFSTVTNSMMVEILQATNVWETAPSIAGWTEGGTPSAPVGASKFGDVSVSYAVKGSESFSAEQPALAGEYVARFTVDGTDDWTALMSEVDFTIAPKPLPHVEATNLSVAYDGTGHGIGVVSTTEGAAVLYALSVDGPYSAELPLFTNAVDATVWYIVSAEGFSTVTNSMTVEILQATNVWVTAPSIAGWTEGGTPSAPVGASKFGDVSVSYAVKGSVSFSAERPVLAGDYVARFTVEETANWSGLEDDVDFTIDPKPLPHVEATGWSVEYDGSGHLATVFSTNENATVLYALSADGPYAVELPLFTNAVNATVWYIVSVDGFATVTNSMTVEVLQATNEWTTVPAIDGWTEGRTPSAPVGASKFGEVSVSYAVKGSVSFSAEQPALAGEYVARFTVDGTDDWTALMSEVDFTIAPKPLPHVEATNLSVAYDGTGHGIGVVSTTEGAAVLYALSVDGPYSAELPLFTNAVNATVWYIVSAEGFSTVTNSMTVEILQATNVWETAPSIAGWTEGGTPSAPVGASKFGEVSVSYAAKGGVSFSTEQPAIAGEYVARFTVEETANWSGLEDDVDFTIDPKPLPHVEATGWSVEYDGSGHLATVFSTNENATVLYALSADGPYAAELPLFTNAVNATVWYIVSAAGFATVTNSMTVEVLQATNEWTTAPAIDGWTEGRTPSAPVGASKFGEVSVSYAAKGGVSFSSEQPAIAGEYVARFTVEETANWTGLENEVEFSVAAKPDDPEPKPEDPDFTLWPDDGSFDGSSALVYDGWIVDADSGVLVGTLQIKTSKTKSSTGTFSVKATVKDVNAKSWSYKNGVGDADSGIVTGLSSSTKGVPVKSFDVTLGRNGMSGTWGGFKIIGARNGMGASADAMKRVLDELYKRSWTVVFTNGLGKTRLVLAVGAKGATTITGTIAANYTAKGKVQAVMGHDAIYIPYLANVKRGTDVFHANMLLKIPGVEGDLFEARDSSFGVLVAAGEPRKDSLGEILYHEGAAAESGAEYSGIVTVDDLAYPVKFSAKGLPSGLKINATTGEIYGTPKKPGIYLVTITVTSKANSKVKATTSVEFNIANFVDALIPVKDSYGEYRVGVKVYEELADVAEGCKVSGLPAGLKFTTKKTTDKVYGFGEIPAFTLYGIPTKAATNTVYFKKTVSQKNASGRTVKSKHQATSTLRVAAMDSWAIGSFNGVAVDDDGAVCGLMPEVDVAKGGKMSGSVIVDDQELTLVSSAYDRYDVDSASYEAIITYKGADGTFTGHLTVSAENLGGFTRGVMTSDVDGLYAWQNLWRSEPSRDLSKLFVGKTLAHSMKFDGGEVTLTIHVGAFGAVAVDGRFALANNAAVYSASCTTTLIPDEDGYVLFVHFPPNATGALNFAGFSAAISLVWNGTNFIVTSVDQSIE